MEEGNAETLEAGVRPAGFEVGEFDVEVSGFPQTGKQVPALILGSGVNRVTEDMDAEWPRLAEHPQRRAPAPASTASATRRQAIVGRVDALTNHVPRALPSLRCRLRSARGWLTHGATALTRAAAARGAGRRPQITSADGQELTRVESYWGRHTVDTLGMWTRRASERQLEWRFAQYPLFRAFSGLWGRHEDETILDYGCGPGNDLVGFALYTGARRIVGIDVSEKALSLAASRLALHRVDPRRIELIRASDANYRVPLADASVDYFQSQGVIHHVSEPDATLRELRRVLRPGGEACVMVYNRDSVWFHLHAAFRLALHDPSFAGLSTTQAFARSTDGPDCPISRCYRGAEFVALCEAAGFEAHYLGGYLSHVEMDALARDRDRAISDERLAAEHRGFLRSLDFDADGYPMHRGAHAGIGGTYRLRRPAGGD